MTDEQLLVVAASGAGFRGDSGMCACSARAIAPKMYHGYQRFHGCTYHPRRQCGWCGTVDRFISSIEARLQVEAEHGPFNAQ